MDREMREEYLVVIQAKDMGGHMGGLSGTTTVTITLTDVNDNPPKFAKSKHKKISSLSCLGFRNNALVINMFYLLRVKVSLYSFELATPNSGTMTQLVS